MVFDIPKVKECQEGRMMWKVWKVTIGLGVVILALVFMLGQEKVFTKESHP